MCHDECARARGIWVDIVAARRMPGGHSDGLIFEEVELAALFVELVFAKVAQGGTVDDKLVVDAFDHDGFYIILMYLTNLYLFEHHFGAVEDVALGVESVVAVGEVFLVDAALIEHIHGLFPRDGHGFLVAFVNEHGQLYAVDDGLHLAFLCVDHGDGDGAFVMDDDSHIAGVAVDGRVDKVDIGAVLVLLDEGRVGGQVVDHTFGHIVGTEDKEFDAAVELMGGFLVLLGGEVGNVVAVECGAGREDEGFLRTKHAR